jgi:hypothetical protein
VQRLARAGWLGFEDDHATPLAFLDRLWESLGPFLLLALAGLVAAAVRRTRADLVLGSFVVLYFAQLMTYEAHFERYALPLIAPLAALAGRFRRLAPVALVLLVVPLVWSVADDVELTRTDTRTVALEWVARELPGDGLVALDSSLPAPGGRSTLGLELPGPGRAYDPDRDLARLRSRGVRYVVANGSVADRVLAARDRYPREARFYDDLRRDATRVYRIDSGDGRAGPWVAVYRL